MKAPNYKGLRSRSVRATAAAEGTSRKKDACCELLLRKAFWRAGLRYHIDAKDLPGRPDIVFRKAKVAIFVDGDFWQGQDLKRRLKQLFKGHNSEYWFPKLKANVTRDKLVTKKLMQVGWVVQRYWETDVRKKSLNIAKKVQRTVS